MSELTTRFLRQLQADLKMLANADCPISQRLGGLADQLDFAERGSPNVIEWDSNRGTFLIEEGHQAIKSLLSKPARRRSDVVFIISAMASALNREEIEITDEHERSFHLRLIRFALENLQGSW